MIIVQLKGGLGNQMFQYAAGRSLALKNKTTLKIDLTFLEEGILGANVDYRKYGLHNFNIVENIIDSKELQSFNRIVQFYFTSKISAINKRIGYIVPINKIYTQKGLGYNRTFEKLSKNTYLSGYWQNTQFFRGYERQIQEDFSFRQDPNKIIVEIIDQLSRCESVAVHVRRGDFTKISQLGTTSSDFYHQAIKKINHMVENPRFFFFSDDINWVKSEFNSKDTGTCTEFIDSQSLGGTDADDLRLMSICKHNIIGNSTYGWWAAWLNNNQNKIIITPKKLFNDSTIDKQLQGMIPDAWIRI